MRLGRDSPAIRTEAQAVHRTGVPGQGEWFPFRLQVPDLRRQIAAAAGLDGAADPRQIASHPAIRTMFYERVVKLHAAGTGSSNRIVAALLVEAPPSSAAGELTEKGTINSRALQRNRPELLEALFGEGDERVLRVEPS